MVSTKLRKILTAVMATGMLLSTASGVSMTVSHTSGLTQANASRRIRKPVRKQQANVRIKPYQARRMKRDNAFVVLHYEPARGSWATLKQNAKLMQRYKITFGVYTDNTGNTAKKASNMVRDARNADFYAVAQPYYVKGVNQRAAAFGNTVKRMSSRPRILYSGTTRNSKSLTDSTRRLFNYNWDTMSNHSGAPVWQFNKGYYDNMIGQLLANKKIHNTMPIELGASNHWAYPLNNSMKAALRDFARGDYDDANREAMSSAMQEYDHSYEKWQVKKSGISSSRITNLARHTARIGAAKSKNFNKYKKRMNQPKNYMLPWKPNYHVYQGSTDGCEIASTRMAMNVLGVPTRTANRRSSNWAKRHANDFSHMIKYAGQHQSYNPEKGYYADPTRRGTGAGIYPQALVKQANYWLRKSGRKGRSTVLADNAYTHWVNHGRVYRNKYYDHGQNRGGRNWGSVQRKLTLSLVRNGHPIVYEGSYRMRHSGSDHVLLLWGIKGQGNNPQMYFSDPAYNGKRIMHTSANNFFKIANENDSLAARGPRAIVVND